MAYVNFKNSPSEETPLTGGAVGNLNIMQENGTSHGDDTKLGYAQSFLNKHIINVSNEVDEDYRVNILKGEQLYNSSNVEIGKTWQGNANNNRARLVLPISPNETYNIRVKGSGVVIAVIETTGTPTSSSTSNATYDVAINTQLTAKAKSTTTYLTLQLDAGTTFTTAILNSLEISIYYGTVSIVVDNDEIYSKPITYPKRSYTYKGLTIDGQRIGNICMVVIGGSLNETLNADTFYDITLETELASIFDVSMNFLTRNNKAGMLRITPTNKLRIYPYASMGSGEALREIITYLGSTD